MIIHGPKLKYVDDKLIIEVSFEYSQGKNTLWYSVDSKYSDFLTSEKVDGFVVALLLLAMRNGENIYLKAPISEKLYFNLENSYINMLSQAIDEFKPIHIYAEKLDAATSYDNKGAVCTGFSGGIDSFSVLYDYFYKSDIPENYRITHLIFNNVGSHGSFDSKKAKQLFDKRYDSQKGFPNEMGIEFIKIDSNLSDVLQMDFKMSHTPRNISCVLLFQKLFSKYYYASGFNYSSCQMNNIDDISNLDPASVHLLSTETLDCISIGSQYTRAQKTEIIANYEPTKRYLNVCTDDTNTNNCSVCSKCLRTFLTLDILGIMHEYSGIMNFQKYAHMKTSYIQKTMLNVRKDVFAKEIIGLAKSKNYVFPLRVRIIEFFIRNFPVKLTDFTLDIYNFLKQTVKRFRV